MKKLIWLVGTFCLLTSAFAQTPKTAASASKDVPRPKLVLGIIVDQMRYDYFYRYYDKYGSGGFKRFLNEGFNAKNHHYHYALTVTAAGHASVYTGSAPAIHGVIGNDWYDPIKGTDVYCVGDTSVTVVGSTSVGAGQMSPKNLLVSTVADQLKLATNFRNKSIGISIKNRGAILPVGHTADAAYWFDSKTGHFISSTFYMKELPKWVQEYNDKKLPSQYAKQGWNTMLPISEYTESTEDNVPWERVMSGEKGSMFPHDLAGFSGNVFGNVSSTPYGNTMVKDMAIAATKNENLGKGRFTDFLAISFSATDAVGHSYGPNSIEVQDVYLRLDKEFEEMFKFFDSWVGKGNYTVFLSADHGVMDVPGYWKSKKLPAGLLDEKGLGEKAKAALVAAFGPGEYIRSVTNYQFYLDHEVLKKKGITQAAVHQVIKDAIIREDAVADVLNLKALHQEQLPEYLKDLYRNLINVKRSGDIQIVPSPNWFAGGSTGTTHGSPYNYDTQTPFAMFGWGVKPGSTVRRTTIADIAPTVSSLLNILAPSGNIGNPVGEALK